MVDPEHADPKIMQGIEEALGRGCSPVMIGGKDHVEHGRNSSESRTCEQAGGLLTGKGQPAVEGQLLHASTCEQAGQALEVEGQLGVEGQRVHMSSSCLVSGAFCLFSLKVYVQS
ncbi:hypothetical protein NL676_013176 [Syzygium grande]|nr:hypothetical protein NL676_013176 [Syzygium grande]